MSARIIEVIETQLRTRGKGTEDDPIRSLTQYWSKDGNLLAEADPCPDHAVNEALIRGAMMNVINHTRSPQYSWTLVRDHFGTGYPRAKELCVAYSVDPDARIAPGQRVRPK